MKIIGQRSVTVTYANVNTGTLLHQTDSGKVAQNVNSSEKEICQLEAMLNTNIIFDDDLEYAIGVLIKELGE